MKKLTIPIVIALATVACGGKTPVPPADGNTVSLERTVLAWNDVEGQYLMISSDEPWGITLEFEDGVPVWVSLTRTGGDGDDMIRLTNNSNNSQVVRSVDIVVRFESESKRIALTQDFNRKDPVDPNKIVPHWTELPQLPTEMGDMLYVKHFTTLADGEPARNYSMLYDPDVYWSYWVAYPEHECYLGNVSRSGINFVKDPLVAEGLQVSLTSSYSPGGNPYQRGHQVPFADRSATLSMAQQTFYCTNMTPQQGSFNGGRWGATEEKLRTVMKANAPDTMYICTGALLHTVGGTEEIKYITNQSDGNTIPVPRYYFKVAIIKSGGIWEGIGFWYDHLNTSEFTGAISYTNNVRTIRQIEALTGFNFFCNLSPADQDDAEMTVDKTFWGF